MNEETKQSWHYVACGTALGVPHMDLRMNKQDAVQILRLGKTIFGVVCDGCTESKSSEVYANLLSRFVIQQMAQLHFQKVALHNMPALLYPMVVNYLRNQIDAMSFGGHYLAALDNEIHGNGKLDLGKMGLNLTFELITHTMLCTIVGFALDEEQGGILFWRGDGTYVINDEIVRIENEVTVVTPDGDQITDKFPAYIGYSLMPPSLITDRDNNPVRLSSPRFNTIAIPPGVKRLAIMSDGLTNEQVKCLWGRFKPKRFNRFITRSVKHGYPNNSKQIWRTYQPIEIQTLLDKFARDRVLEDDAGVIVVERVEYEPENVGGENAVCPSND